MPAEKSLLCSNRNQKQYLFSWGCHGYVLAYEGGTRDGSLRTERSVESRPLLSRID